MSEVLNRLGERDPSIPLALAAIVRDADDNGIIDLATLGPSYRETVVTARAQADEDGPELSSDEVHENLTRSVLPRLADEKWITSSREEDWTLIRAHGPLWEEARAHREAARTQLLEAGVHGMRRRASRGQAAPPPVPSGSVLEGKGLYKTFRRRTVVDNVG